MKPKDIYVFDTEAFITCFDYYQEDIFPSFWRKLHALIKEERIVSVSQVFYEIKRHKDRINRWEESVKKTLFSKPCENELQIVEEISNSYPELVDEKKRMDKKHIADHFVIARAKVMSGHVVTQDGFCRNGVLKKSKKKLAFVCKEYGKQYGLDCFPLDAFMRREKWKF